MKRNHLPEAQKSYDVSTNITVHGNYYIPTGEVKGIAGFVNCATELVSDVHRGCNENHLM